MHYRPKHTEEKIYALLIAGVPIKVNVTLVAEEVAVMVAVAGAISPSERVPIQIGFAPHEPSAKVMVTFGLAVGVPVPEFTVTTI